MVINSFKDRRSVYTNTFGLPEQWNFSNYTDVLASGDIIFDNEQAVYKGYDSRSR